MPNFNINSFVTTQQTLTGNEIGILGPAGSIQVLYLSGVQMGERSGVTVAGSIISAGGHGIFALDSIDTAINILPGGTVTSTYIPDISVNTISMVYSESLFINNAGTILGNALAVRAVGGPDSQSVILNSGLIQSSDRGVSQTQTSGDASLINSGQILTEGIAVRMSVVGGDIELHNSGSITASSNALSFGSGDVSVFNTGTITSRWSAISSDPRSVNTLEVINQGQINGWIDATAAADTVDNRGGAIIGDIYMQQGDDVVNTRGGQVLGYVDMGEGNDRFLGSEGGDSVTGGFDDDTLRGHEGDDTLDGGAGFDVLQGNAGDDILSGGGRNDVLTGGKGDDTMTGGGGGDVFVIRRVGNGDDEVTDFQNNADAVDISALGVQNFNHLANLYNALSQTTDGVVVDLAAAGGSGSILLRGVSLADMDASDFVF